MAMGNTRYLPLTAFALLLSGPLSSVAHASGSPAAGKQKAATCVACHGEDGKGTAPEFPVLAGQYSSYLEQALKQYKSGERKNAIMAGFAAALSEQDIKDLAAYYARMASDLTTPEP